MSARKVIRCSVNRARARVTDHAEYFQLPRGLHARRGEVLMPVFRLKKKKYKNNNDDDVNDDDDDERRRSEGV